MNIRLTRFLVAFISPPLVGAILMSSLISVVEWPNHKSFGFFGVFEIIAQTMLLSIPASIVSFYIIGAQSLIYAALMEFVFEPTIKSKYLFIIISTILGSLSGATAIGKPGFLPFIILGAVVGTIVGIILETFRKQNA